MTIDLPKFSDRCIHLSALQRTLRDLDVGVYMAQKYTRALDHELVCETELDKVEGPPLLQELRPSKACELNQMLKEGITGLQILSDEKKQENLEKVKKLRVALEKELRCIE